MIFFIVLLDTSRPERCFDQSVKFAPCCSFVTLVLLPEKKTDVHRAQSLVVISVMIPQLKSLVFLIAVWRYRPILHPGCFRCASYSMRLAIAGSLQATKVALDPRFCLLVTRTCFLFPGDFSSSHHLLLGVDSSYGFSKEPFHSPFQTCSAAVAASKRSALIPFWFSTAATRNPEAVSLMAKQFSRVLFLVRASLSTIVSLHYTKTLLTRLSTLYRWVPSGIVPQNFRRFFTLQAPHSPLFC